MPIAQSCSFSFSLVTATNVPEDQSHSYLRITGLHQCTTSPFSYHVLGLSRNKSSHKHLYFSYSMTGYFLDSLHMFGQRKLQKDKWGGSKVRSGHFFLQLLPLGQVSAGKLLLQRSKTLSGSQPSSHSPRSFIYSPLFSLPHPDPNTLPLLI